jgi:glycosyltransferase involved in cell wall biosynthesis
MNRPLVSIITPTYNHERFISDCINSVLNQTYQNWEMIIVDDGSTDNTFRIAEEFAKGESRIKVFTQKNIGIFRLAETYNFALLQSSGKYIAVLEGDDVWLPEKLEKQIPLLEENEDVVLSWGRAFSSSVDLSVDYNMDLLINRDEKIITNTPVKSACEDFLYINFIPALTVILRRSTLESIGGFIQNFNLPLVDLPTWQQIALLGKFSFVDEPLGKWRYYPTQATKTYTVEITEGFYQLAQSYYQQNKSYFDSIQFKEKKLHKFYRKKLVICYSRSGRYKLIRKEFKSARKDYFISIFRFGFNEPVWKLRSLIGILFSIFNTDIEKFTKLLGRVSYKE